MRSTTTAIFEGYIQLDTFSFIHFFVVVVVFFYIVFMEAYSSIKSFYRNSESALPTIVAVSHQYIYRNERTCWRSIAHRKTYGIVAVFFSLTFIGSHTYRHSAVKNGIGRVKINYISTIGAKDSFYIGSSSGTCVFERYV